MSELPPGPPERVQPQPSLLPAPGKVAECQPLAAEVLQMLAAQQRFCPPMGLGLSHATSPGHLAGATGADFKALSAVIPPPPGLPAPPGLATPPGLSLPEEPAEAQAKRIGEGGAADDAQSKRLTLKFVFNIDMEQHADFELVPRLIGRGGKHMRDIAQACGGKVRIRGRGSGHKEQQKRGQPAVEADVPLQIALSCRDRSSLQEGKLLLEEFLKGMCVHFERYCKRNRISPVPELYSLTCDP